jgi:hypothetical protein
MEISMSYLHIDNLYKVQDILLFKECYALEKVHGTSAHLAWRKSQLHLSPGTASSKLFNELFDVPAMTGVFREKFGDAQPVTVYGEAHGGKLLGMSKTYGISLKFVAFDVKVGDLWLSVPQAEDVASKLGLQFVHYVKTSTDLESLNACRDSPSVQAIRNGMGDGHIREGVVLRPLIELRKNNDDRIIAKHKRDEFRETSETRSVEVDPARLKVLADAEQVANEWVTAMRFNHVVDKMLAVDHRLTVRRTKEAIDFMLEDVLREGAGEFVDSQEVRKAISKKAAGLYADRVATATDGGA